VLSQIFFCVFPGNGIGGIVASCISLSRVEYVSVKATDEIILCVDWRRILFSHDVKTVHLQFYSSHFTLLTISINRLRKFTEVVQT